MRVPGRLDDAMTHCCITARWASELTIETCRMRASSDSVLKIRDVMMALKNSPSACTTNPSMPLKVGGEKEDPESVLVPLMT